MPLTDDAKAAIADALRIIREDKFEAYARQTLGKHTPKVEATPKVDELIVDEKDVITPPPPKEEDKTPKGEDKPKRKSAYWGEILDD